jgi:hypothetical protein
MINIENIPRPFLRKSSKGRIKWKETALRLNDELEKITNEKKQNAEEQQKISHFPRFLEENVELTDNQLIEYFKTLKEKASKTESSRFETLLTDYCQKYEGEIANKDKLTENEYSDLFQCIVQISTTASYIMEDGEEILEIMSNELEKITSKK